MAHDLPVDLADPGIHTSIDTLTVKLSSETRGFLVFLSRYFQQCDGYPWTVELVARRLLEEYAMSFKASVDPGDARRMIEIAGMMPLKGPMREVMDFCVQRGMKRGGQ